ncbi:GNAT family N-acetyltransferase [Sporomusa malonica]|uniref:N-acetylglutamate synthase, GNAT family n=1 Tax=Sporomusa malonica TaxID=112901 RepID=A0A1W2DYG6_9FIRM|nr:GNAT family N-acetyltransferase [Sporomusa malonica]SMD02544.1 N-acetylglutamate synthase, GNAT family [Sporomusa malonica]
MNIRKATIDDIDILIKLRIDYLLADNGNLTTDEKNAIRSQLTTYFSKHINHDFIAILAETDNNILSTAFLAISEKPANPAFITGKTGTLLNVLTYPEYRRIGIASRVISKIIDEAKQLGVSSINLSATKEGKPLYEKLGFTESPKYTSMKMQLV